MDITDNIPTDAELKARARKYVKRLRKQIAADRPGIVDACERIEKGMRERLAGFDFDLSFRVKYNVDHLEAEDEDQLLKITVLIAPKSPGMVEAIKDINDDFGIPFNFPSVDKHNQYDNNELWCYGFMDENDEGVPPGHYALVLSISEHD